MTNQLNISMLNINEQTVIDQLRKFSVYLQGSFEEGVGAAKLEIDNNFGKGIIKSYQIANGLSLRTYNVTFKKDFEFTISNKDKASLYLIYCLKGHYFHRFGLEHLSTQVVELQNVILASGVDTEHNIRLPKDIALQISVIHVHKDELEDRDSRKNLSVALEDLFVHVNSDKPYKYLGKLNPTTAEFARIIIETKSLTVVGRLLMEAAMLNTLASQLQHHDQHKEGLNFDAPLTKSELDVIITVCNYIDQNLTIPHTLASLEAFSGMNRKKLQKGFRYLFGENVNGFIQDVRFKKAKELLQLTDLTISEVVYSIGLGNRSYFSKSFQEKFGISPSEYKKQFEGEDTIFELSYKSQAIFGLRKADVDDIVTTARINNEKLNISGCLVSFNNQFFQILEGTKKEVLTIFEKIKQDSRHKDIELLWKGSKNDRIFEEWSLGYISESGIFHNKKDNPSMSINLSSILSQFPGSGITSKLFWIQLKNMIKVNMITA